MNRNFSLRTGFLLLLAALAFAARADNDTGPALDEGLLGVEDPPFVVGDVLTEEQFAELSCIPTDIGLLNCPIELYGNRMFGVMIDDSEGDRLVSACFVYWPCGSSGCDQVLESTVALYTELLGRGPEILAGHPIWKDRERSRRDLLITTMHFGLITVVLLKSDP